MYAIYVQEDNEFCHVCDVVLKNEFANCCRDEKKYKRKRNEQQKHEFQWKD